MIVKLIDGKVLVVWFCEECWQWVWCLYDEYGVVFGFVVVLVGDDLVLVIYVVNKVKVCVQVGIWLFYYQLGSDVRIEEFVQLIMVFNVDCVIYGILVQLFVFQYVDMCVVLEVIVFEKDVDGFYFYNVGGLVSGNMVFLFCMFYGVVKLFESEGIVVEGQNVVVVGVSNIVGKLMVLMLMYCDVIVVICYVKICDLVQFMILVDILVVVVGVLGLIVLQMVKCGVVVIDVGINCLFDGCIVGDIDFVGVLVKVLYIMLVLGGVGLMMVMMLLVNILFLVECGVVVLCGEFDQCFVVLFVYVVVQVDVELQLEMVGCDVVDYYWNLCEECYC